MADFDWGLIDPFPTFHASYFAWSSVLERANIVNNAEVFYSDDGINWSAGVAPSATDDIQFPLWDTSQSGFFGIIYNRPLAKYYGCKSVDGITWTYTGEITGTFPTWTGLVANGGGRLLAITAAGDCYRSDDGGSSWTNSGSDLITIDATPSTLWNTPIFNSGGSLFVVFNFNALGSIPIASSPDGVTWTGRRGFEPTYLQDWITAADSGTLSIALSQGNGVVITSSDGATWTYQTELVTQFPGFNNIHVHGVMYSEELLKFVVFSYDNTADLTRVFLTEDGLVWTEDAALIPPCLDLGDVENNSWYGPYDAPQIEKFFGLSTTSSLTPVVISPLDSPPPEPDLEIIGEGGIEAGDGGDGFNEFSSSGTLFIHDGFSDYGGGLEVGGVEGAEIILSVDPSGIYTLVPGKRYDTLYNRADPEDVDTIDVAIPRPFIRTAFIGG
jgi:hypothetical protein